jgi:hypothetical protein
MTGSDPMAGLAAADAAPFLARLTRLDPAALVRLRPAGPGLVALWGRAPWGVLVSRRVPGESTVDVTVSASALLHGLTEGAAALPPVRDRDWRWGLPPEAAGPVEKLPAAELIRLGAAAASTLREAHGRIGERMLRDALLDHVSIVVSSGSARVEVRQALVQALLRMGFVATENDGPVTVGTAGGWVSLSAKYGDVWQQKRKSLAFRIVR